MMTYRRKGHAEHDNQSYVPDGEIEHWASTNDPLDRYRARLVGEFGVDAARLDALDAEVAAEVDAATDQAEASPPCEGPDALVGVYADPAAMPVLWYRGEASRAVDAHERPASWGTHDG
jgi:TPP-dependent pyruvate/acetoin dehydrogenase alpha subunit